MKKILTLTFVLVLVCTVFLAGCSSTGAPTTATSAAASAAPASSAAASAAPANSAAASDVSTSKKIVLVNPLVGNTWWSVVEKGFYDECKKLGYEGVSTGPTSGTVEDHLNAMQTVLVEKPAAIITIALNPTAYDPVLEKYKAAGIPVITFYGDATKPDLRLSYIGCDYNTIGETEIQTIIKAVKDASGQPPMLGVLVGTLDQDSHMIRPEIYQKYMDDNNIKGKVVDVQPTNSDPTTAASLLQTMTLGHPEMNALICVEGTSGAALGKEYKLLNLAEKKFTLIVGGDQEEMVNAINDGAYGTMTFDAYGAAAKAVDVLDSYLKGEKADSSYTWPGLMVTNANKAEYIAKMGW